MSTNYFVSSIAGKLELGGNNLRMYPLTLGPVAFSSVWKFNNLWSFIHSSVLFSTPYDIAMLVMSIKIPIQDKQQPTKMSVLFFFCMSRGRGGGCWEEGGGRGEGGNHHSF